MIFRADLHIHSCLSPCGSLEMSPDRIVREAQRAGLNALALTDHNSALNTPAFQFHCQAAGIAALFGLEANTTEDVHMLCLFDDPTAALELGAEIYEQLAEFPNDPLRFGDQVQVNEHNEVLSQPERLLIAACRYDTGELLRRVHEKGGLVIPSHIDREYCGILNQLGFLPSDPYDAVEISRRNLAVRRVETYNGYPVTTASDAHQPEAIGTAWIEFEADHFNVGTLRRALAEGRVRPIVRPA